MFKAETRDPRLLRDSIDTISQIIDDGLFRLKKDGIELLAADRAMVSVVDFKLKSTAFEIYMCDKERKVGVNLLNLLTLLKRAGPDDKLTLELNETENKLEITLQGKSERKLAIPLIEMSQEDVPQIDKFEFAALAEVKSDVLEQGINDADIVADSVVIELADTTMRMSAAGNGSKTEMKLEKGNDALININTKTKVRSRYSLEYLKKMIKGAKLAEITRLHMGNPQQKDYPIKVEFKGEHASLNILIAPRVEEE